MDKAVVLVRPPLHGEMKYLYTTSRSIVIARAGERDAGFDHVYDLVNDILGHCALSVAIFEGMEFEYGMPVIQGFVVRDPRDGSVEFMHLRKLYRDMSSPLLAAKVAGALLGGAKECVLRRIPSWEALEAIVASGCAPTIKLRSM